MKTYIYVLKCPTINKIRYVGKTNTSIERYRNHLNKLHGEGTYKRNWINSLRKKGQKPYNIMKVKQIDAVSGKIINIYDSIKEAQNDLGISYISCAINGNHHTAGGFKWEKEKV